MNKILCASQNTEAKTLPADVCIFGHFRWLSPAAVHSADCRFDSGVNWWIHVSSIVIYLHKNSFFAVLKQLQTMLWIINTLFLINCEQMRTYFEHSFLIDKCSCKMVNTLLSDIFNLSAISLNLFMISQNEFVEFFGVFRDNCRIWATWIFSIICVCTTTFKVSILPVNHCFWWSNSWGWPEGSLFHSYYTEV